LDTATEKAIRAPPLPRSEYPDLAQIARDKLIAAAIDRIDRQLEREASVLDRDLRRKRAKILQQKAKEALRRAEATRDQTGGSIGLFRQTIAPKSRSLSATAMLCIFREGLIAPC